MYRAYCFKDCHTLLFDIPDVEALFGEQKEEKITCRGCGRTFTLTTDGKDIFYQHGKRKPQKAVYYH